MSSDQWKRIRPVAGMAPEAGRDLLEAVAVLRRKEGFPLVIVEHRLRQVQPHVNRVLVMRVGRIVDDTWETERMPDADRPQPDWSCPWHQVFERHVDGFVTIPAQHPA